MIIVHNLEEAEAALAAGETALQSAPDALFYAGSMYLLDMFRKAQAAYPKAQAAFILDCGDAGAEVIAAMQDGHKTIKSSAKPEIRAKLKAIALKNGVNFIETI